MRMSDNTLVLDGAAIRGLLPYGGPSLLIDRVVSYDPLARSLTTEKSVSQSEPFVQGHFPTFPLLPGVVVIEALAQACRLFMLLSRISSDSDGGAQLAAMLRTKPRPSGFLVESSVKHTATIVPGQRLQLTVYATGITGRLHSFRVTAQVDGIDAARGRLTLADLPADEDPPDGEVPQCSR
jgi:3-hydroxyacyl-[acyl-carrier-protein] dehydratase